MGSRRLIASLLLLWLCATALPGCRAGGEPSQDVEPDGRVSAPVSAPVAAGGDTFAAAGVRAAV